MAKGEAAGTGKHTPGPWEVRVPGGTRAARHGWREVWGPDRALVIGASVVDVSAADGETWSEGGVPMSEANARLIAATPDLLACAIAADEALSNACDPVKDSLNPLEALRWNLRAAIAKATTP